MKYTIIFDIGKPYEVVVDSDEALEKELREFYINSIKDKDDFAYCDVKVYDENDEDITEAQFINEMVSEIMEEVE